MAVIFIKGGPGAGKSTLIRQLMWDRTAVLLEHFSPEGGSAFNCYELDASDLDTTLYVLGKYNLEPFATKPSPGSGGDHVQGAAGFRALAQYSDRGIVIQEGVKFMGQEYIAGLVQNHGPVFWGTMDTPHDEQIDRIFRRRIERQVRVGSPLNRESTFSISEGHRKRAANPYPGVRSYWIRHTDAMSDLLGLIELARTAG